MADDTKQTKSATKTASVLFGSPQLGLTHVDRQVPLDEPPPLAADASSVHDLTAAPLKVTVQAPH